MVRIASSLLFIIVLLLIYANLPDRVGITDSSINTPGLFLPKSDFFYYCLIIFLATNAIAFVFGKVFQSIAIRPETFFFSSEIFKDRFTTWWGVFPAVMNLIFMFSLGFIAVFNNHDMDMIRSYSYLPFLGQFLVAGWIIALIVVLLKRDR